MPVGSISNGTVRFAGRSGSSLQPGQTSIGYTVNILGNSNEVYDYHHLQNVYVKVGDKIGIGQPLGTVGGCPDGCYSGTSCSCTDSTSDGPHIEVRFSYTKIGSENGNDWIWTSGNWIDPYQIFIDIGNAPAGTDVWAGRVPSGGSFGQFGQAVLQNNPFAPNDTVTQFLASLDQAQTITPFWNVDTSQISTSFFPGGPSIVDPTKYLGEVAFNASADIFAILIDTILIVGGIFIIFKVFARVVNLSGMISTAGRLAGTAAMVA